MFDQVGNFAGAVREKKPGTVFNIESVNGSVQLLQ